MQIIEEQRKPTFADKFGQAMSGGAEAFSQFMGARQQKEQQQQIAEKLKQLTGMDLSGLPPEMQMEALKQFSQTQRAKEIEGLKQQGKEGLLQQKQSYLDKLFGGPRSQQSPQQNKFLGITSPELIGKDPIESQVQDMLQQQGMDASQILDEDIARATAMDANLGRILQSQKDVALREKRSREEFQHKREIEGKKEVTDSYNENKDFINKTYDQYEDSNRKEAITDRMNELNDSGELSDSGIINALESLGLNAEWLKNPANEEYNKLSLDLLGGGTLQADYGSRIFASEFKVAQQRIPSLSQTQEGRRQIAENIRTLLLPAKLKHERMQYYLDQAERTGKPLPHNLRGKILKDIKPQLDEAYDKFKQRNGRYKVRDGTIPDDNAIEKYFYIANGNDEKAMKMMKEDGYDID